MATIRRTTKDTGCGCLVPLTELGGRSGMTVEGLRAHLGDEVKLDWKGDEGVSPAVARRVVEEYRASRARRQRELAEERLDREAAAEERAAHAREVERRVLAEAKRRYPAYSGFGPQGGHGPLLEHEITREAREMARKAYVEEMRAYDRKHEEAA